MADTPRSPLLYWTVFVPLLAMVALALTWGRDLGAVLVVAVAVILAGAALAAVHHAEVVAHRVGEPFGSLVLAVAVTVFAAVMITTNGIVGISLLLGALRYGVTLFNAEGAGAALATVATLSLVLPTFTTSQPGPQFSPAQLTFAALVSLALYGMFVLTQTVRHRNFFLPVTSGGVAVEVEDHALPPTGRAAATSLGLLVVALVAVVGLAKVESPAIEAGVEAWASRLPSSVW